MKMFIQCNLYGQMVHTFLEKGKVKCFICLTNNDNEKLDHAMEAWNDDVYDEVSINSHFKISEILDSAIDLKEMPRHGGAIDERDKPLFMAMRTEIQLMIEKIDQLKFITPKEQA